MRPQFLAFSDTEFARAGPGRAGMASRKRGIRFFTEIHSRLGPAARGGKWEEERGPGRKPGPSPDSAYRNRVLTRPQLMRLTGEGTRQDVASQAGRSPCQTAGAAQLASVVKVQLSSWVQHAPCGGCGHGLGLHVTHSACQTSGAAQSAWVVTVQPPVAVQQAPGGGGHGFGSQTVLPDVQFPSVQLDA